MTSMPNTAETPAHRPDPVNLLQTLSDLSTDQKKYNHLRDLFLEEADVDEYINYLDTDEEIDLTRRQLTQLKAALEGYKVYLKDYLKETGERIGRFDERLKQTSEAFANPDATPEELAGIGKTRKRVAQAMQIAKAPRGSKGKNLREVTQSKKELSPEEIDQYLGEFKTRFDALPELHKGIEWADVEKSLKADPEAVRKLMELDAAGFEMNVFSAKNDSEIQFRTAQLDITQIAPEYRTIMFDKKAQTDSPGSNVNGNAVDIAASMGVELADKELYEKLRVKNGWVWLKTDVATRETGSAFNGDRVGVGSSGAGRHGVTGSFCAALRVKKA